MPLLNVHDNISAAETLSADFYTSDAWYELAKEKIFAKTWQFSLVSDDLKRAGQLVPFTLLPGLLNEPLLFIRDEEDHLHCISNVCTHRANLLIEGPCVAQQIRCRYHGRRFNLQGELLHMPEFEQAENFPSAQDNLTKLPFEQLGNFIFTALDPTYDFASVFHDLKKRLFWYPFHELRLDAKRSRDYLVKAHWALYCENYLEPLHIPFIHKSLRSTLDFANYRTELYPHSNLQFALANDGEMCFDLPQNSHDYGLNVAAYYYWIFPNTMLNFYPWGCSVNVVKPLSPELTKVSFLSFVFDESKIHAGAGGQLDRVEREDEAVVEAVQIGIRSRFYSKGRYSPTMEQGTHHFHQLLCKYLNQ